MEERLSARLPKYILVLGFLALAWYLGNEGVATLNAPQRDAAYFAMPACDRALLFDGRTHAGTPCAIVDATIAHVDVHHPHHRNQLLRGTVSNYTFTVAGADGPAAFDAVTEGSPLGAAGDRVRLQLFTGSAGNVVSAIFAPARNRSVTADAPEEKHWEGWGEIAAALIFGAVTLAIFSYYWIARTRDA